MSIIDSDRFKKVIGSNVKSAYGSLVFLIVASYIDNLTIDSIVALGEEVGWRAHLSINLYEGLGLVNAMILTGLVWGYGMF